MKREEVEKDKRPTVLRRIAQEDADIISANGLSLKLIVRNALREMGF